MQDILLCTSDMVTASSRSAPMVLPKPNNSSTMADILSMIDSGILKYREQDLFIPASTLKILTCLVALEQLGKIIGLKHIFFSTRHNNLYIKGYGDPFLTSEAILEIGTKLAGLGIQYSGITLSDESSFALNGETAGMRIPPIPMMPQTGLWQ